MLPRDLVGSGLPLGELRVRNAARADSACSCTERSANHRSVRRERRACGRSDRCTGDERCRRLSDQSLDYGFGQLLGRPAKEHRRRLGRADRRFLPTAFAARVLAECVTGLARRLGQRLRGLDGMRRHLHRAFGQVCPEATGLTRRVGLELLGQARRVSADFGDVGPRCDRRLQP